MKNYTIKIENHSFPSRNYCENEYETKEEAQDYLKFTANHLKRNGADISEITENSFTIENYSGQEDKCTMSVEEI